MNAKKMAKILKEIEDSSILVEYLTHIGHDLENDLCGCYDKECHSCKFNDDTLFSDKRVKEAREWKDGD